MNQYLLPAGYEFQKVQHDYERLRQGKELFHPGTLEALGQAKDNNERYEQLQRIRKDLLPFYDDVPAAAPELIGVAAETIKEARETATVSIETTFGNFDGSTAEQVANEALQLIDDLRYVDIDLTFRTLCNLYLGAASNDERKRILQSFEALARNDINVWRQVGFGVQKVLCEAIRALPERDKETLRPVIVSVCSLFLETELQGTTWHFDSVNLQRSAVRASTPYGEFRRDVLGVLFDLYGKAASLVEKLQVIQALGTATHFPMDGGRDDLIELVLDDTRQIVEFFCAHVEGEPFEILQHLEHQYLWLYRRSKEIAAGNAEPRIRTKASAVAFAIETFRDRINSDERFVKFKTLVGFESVFPPEWDGDAMDIESPQAYRAARITEYVASITSENADEWFSVIQLCTTVKSDDLATFPSLGEFLKQLATRSPDIVIGYLKKDEEALSNFLPAILAGFGEGAHPELGLSLVREWIGQGRHLAAIAHYLRFTETPVDLVSQLGEQVIRQEDAIAAMGTIAAIITRQIVSLVDSTFLPVLRMLTELKDARWVNGAWFLKTLRPFLETLSQEQSEVILENLLLCERIDHHDEWVLRVIAGRYPAAVWDFFKDRIDRKENTGSEERYEPVPFDMKEIGQALSKDAPLAVQKVRSWYSPGDHMFTYSGGRMLHNVFPTFTKEFEAELLKLLQSGAADDINFTLNVLDSYQGGQFLHEVCKELIEVLPEDDKRIGKVEIILESTGVVSGQFGMVQAYQHKKEEVQGWLTDQRSKVRTFAEKYQRSLDRSIAAEQRRSETDYELRRREWSEEE